MGLKTKIEKLEAAADERAEQEFDAYLGTLTREQLEAIIQLVEDDLAGQEIGAFIDSGPRIGPREMLEACKQMVASL